MHLRTASAAILLPLALAACDLPLRPEGRHAVGIIAWEARPSLASSAGTRPADPPRTALTAPDTVRAGVPFTARVTTVGPTVCWSPAGARVEARPAEAVVTPIDHTLENRDTACGDATVELPRDVELAFGRPGEAVLRVTGRRVVGRDLGSSERIVLEKRIVVR
ncbi:MAG TPA: hypothetical protein VGR37_19195 [Longimicrobiaceae bacterium]|nr:hypothetical protein [Longimicrobiaceae bacterium]